MGSLSRRRLLRGLGLASLGVVATTRGTRTAMAVSDWEDTTLTYSSSDGTLPSLQLSANDLSFEFAYSNFPRGPTTVGVVLEARSPSNDYEPVLSGEFSADKESDTRSVEGSDLTDGSFPVHLLTKESISVSDFTAETGETRTTDVEFRLRFSAEGETITVETTCTVEVTNTSSAIPDSVVNRWPSQEGSGSTIADVVGSSDISLTGDPKWESGTWIGNHILRFDGVDDYGVSTATTPSGSMTSAVTVDFDTDITDIRTLHNFGPSTAVGDGRLLRFRGDLGTNTVQFLVSNGTDPFAVNTTINQGKHRIAGVLDTSASEIRISVDGVVENTTSVSGTFDGTVSNHYIGRRVDSAERYYGGGIDEPLLANEAWDAQTLSDDYNRQPWS